MANQRVIEILLQLRQQGQEVLKNIDAGLAGIGASAADAKTSIGGFAPASREATAAVRNFGKEANAAMAGAASAAKTAAAESESAWGNFLKSTKAQLGRGSEFGESFHLLMGGGAIIGLKYAGEAFKGLSESLLDLKKAANAAGGDWGTLVEKIGKGLPIFSAFYEGGLNIRQFFTGELAAITQMEETTRREVTMTNAIWELRKKIIAEGIDDTKKWADLTEGLDEKLQLLKAVSGGRPALEAQFAAARDQRVIDDLADAEIAKAERDRDAAVKAYYAAVKGVPEQYVGSEQNPVDPQRAMDAMQKKKSAAGPFQVMDAQAAGTGLYYADQGTAGMVASSMGGSVGLANNPQLDSWLERVQNAATILHGAIRPIDTNIANISTAANAASAKQGEVNAATADDARIEADIAGTNKAFEESRASFNEFAAELKKLFEEGAALTKAVETPRQKYNAELDQSQNLLSAGLITPEVQQQADTAAQSRYLKALAAAQKEGFQIGEERAKAEAEVELIVAKASDDPAAVRLAQLKAELEKERRAIQEAWETGMIPDRARYDAALLALDKQMLKAEADERKAAEEERQAKALAKLQAGAQVTGLVGQATGNTQPAQLAQIGVEAAEQTDALQKSYDQGLIDYQKFEDGRQAIAQIAEQKRLMIEGSFTDGVKLGYQRMTENVTTDAQLGFEVSQRAYTDLQDGFSTAFEQIVTGTKSVADAFRLMAASILDDIAKILVKQAAANILQGRFGGTGAAADNVPTWAGALDFAGGASGAWNRGGLIPAYAIGGTVAGGLGGGGPDRDSVLAALTPGEFVVRRSAVQAPGVLGMLQGLNAGGTAGAGSAALAAGGGGIAVHAGYIVANDAAARMLLAGGRNGALGWMADNASLVRSAIGVG